MKGLLIRSPWIDLILSGQKTWEMRSTATSIRGTIALIRAGSGQVVGTADLVDSLPALSLEQLRETQHLHGIPDASMEEVAANRWTTPWVLENVVKFSDPVPYQHPSGAVTWVNLPDPLGAPPSVKPAQAQNIRSDSAPVTAAARAESVDNRPAIGSAWVDIPLTEGNIRNNHFYLRAAERLLPTDSIGGSRKEELARNLLSVEFSSGTLVKTDIAGDKMILRARGAVRDFFSSSGARAGDAVRFAKTGTHSFHVSLVRGGERG